MKTKFISKYDKLKTLPKTKTSRLHTSKTRGTSASEGGDWIDGAKQHRFTADEA